MPTEPKINYLDQSEQVSEKKPQKRKAFPEPEEPNRAKEKVFLYFDLVSTPQALTQR